MDKDVEYPATLIRVKGYWFIVVPDKGTIDLGDDIPQWLELLEESMQ